MFDGIKDIPALLIPKKIQTYGAVVLLMPRHGTEHQKRFQTTNYKNLSKPQQNMTLSLNLYYMGVSENGPSNNPAKKMS